MVIGKVETVTLIKHISEGLDYCKIRIDFDELKIFGVYGELCEYIGKTVEYVVRQDVFEGEPITVVCNVYQQHVVQTLKEDKNIVLLPEVTEESRVVSNLDISTLRTDDRRYDCIAFLSEYECCSSTRARWVECTLVDMKSKMFKMKMFENSSHLNESIEEVIEKCVGSYVKFDIACTRYGYQSDKLEYCNITPVCPPEVDTAIAIINEAVVGDEELQAYMQTFDFINTMKKTIDGELGYPLVRIATEISLIRTLGGLSRLYDQKLLIRAAITSRGYLLPSKTKFSRPVLNTNKLLRSALSKDRELMLILDVFAEEDFSPTKKMYVEISNLANRIVDERRGLYEEFSKTDNYNMLRTTTGGLL